VDSPESLNTSSALWYNTVVLGKSLDKTANEGSAWIDVRDLAQYHVRALQNEPAGGERIIVSACASPLQMLAMTNSALTDF
jgi:nucleoside-diphosphate-sugar epimerase